MNSSLQRLIDGMAATLRNEVIPHLDTEFARGQAFGVIYMLNSIALRSSWSPAFIGKQLAAQADLGQALAPLLGGLNAPAPPRAASAGLDVPDLEALRDDNDARICALIDWHATAPLETARSAAIEAQFRIYIDRQLRHELHTSAKPMFAEMSSGSE